MTIFSKLGLPEESLNLLSVNTILLCETPEAFPITLKSNMRLPPITASNKHSIANSRQTITKKI